MVEMVRMKAVGDTASVSIGSDSFEVVDGYISVPAALAGDVQSHGFIIADGDEEDPNSVPNENIDTMKRGELFAFLKAKGINKQPPVTNDELRRLAKEANGETVEPVTPTPAPEPVAPAAPEPPQTTQEPASAPEPAPAAEQQETSDPASVVQTEAQEQAPAEPAASDINEHTV